MQSYICNGQIFNCMFSTGESTAGHLFGYLKNIVSLELNSVTINVKWYLWVSCNIEDSLY